MRVCFIVSALPLIASTAIAQTPVSSSPKPADTEVWKPVRVVVNPGQTTGDPPSDAVILFDGKSLDAWASVRDGSPAKWRRERHVTVNKAAGRHSHKDRTINTQLHIEWRVPENITGATRRAATAGCISRGGANGEGVMSCRCSN